jgi:hypothetical protein
VGQCRRLPGCRPSLKERSGCNWHYSSKYPPRTLSIRTVPHRKVDQSRSCPWEHRVHRSSGSNRCPQYRALRRRDRRCRCIPAGTAGRLDRRTSASGPCRASCLTD